MKFEIPREIEAYRLKIRDFVEEHILPLETRPEVYDEYENIRDEYLMPLREKAKLAGLWCLQMPKERGGQGLPVVGLAVCYEEMNRSIFGPVVFNSAAPEDGNMIVLNKVATEAQKGKWLVACEIYNS